MRKIFTILILISFLLPLSFTNAQNEVEAIVIAKADNSIEVLFGDDYADEIRVYELQMRGDCMMQDFNPGYMIGVLTEDDTWPIPGDSIIGSINIFSDFTFLNDVQSKEFTDCQIVSAVYKKNENYEMFYVKKTGNQEYLLESIYENYYAVSMSDYCLEESLGQESVIIVKKLLVDGLNNADEIVSGIKVTDESSIDFISLNNCNIGSATELSINSGRFEETLAIYNQLIFEDKDKHATLAVTVRDTCSLLSYNLGNNSDIGLYDLGEIYYSANKANSDDQALYISYDDIFCPVEKFRVINDYIDPITRRVLYEVPFSYYYKPPVVNYYVRGQYNKRIYTDRPDPKTLIGNIVKGETDPATYTVDNQGELRWIRGENVAKRLYGQDWDSEIIWFSDSIIYTYKFGESIYE
ncbi:hypothetical protein ACFL2U_03400 [Patescibacteria group bacterium]